MTESNNRSIHISIGLLLLLAVILPACSKESHPPVILIVIDTLRTDALGCYGAERTATPSLDEWARESILFESAYSQSPWTLPSFASLFTSTFPTENGAGIRQGDKKFYPFNEKLVTAAESFKSHGYSTAAFVNNIFLRGEFGFQRGFDEYNFFHATVHKIRKAEEVTNTAIGWLKMQRREGSPYFMVLHYFDPHFHYLPPQQYKQQFDCELMEEVLAIDHPDRIRSGALALNEWDRLNLKNLYLAEVAYTDHHVGRFLDHIQKEGVLDEALVVITADHGEEFWDHDGFEHGHTQYEELVKVPLMMRFPGTGDGETNNNHRIATPVRLMDIMPSVHEWLGLPAPDTFRGTSFLGEIGSLGDDDLLGKGGFPGGAGASRGAYNVPLYFESCMYGGETKALRARDLKLILDTDTDKSMLFDLKADPGELTDLSATRAEDAQKLKEALLKIHENLQGAADSGKQALDLSSDVLKDLHGLGYL